MSVKGQGRMFRTRWMRLCCKQVLLFLMAVYSVLLLHRVWRPVHLDLPRNSEPNQNEPKTTSKQLNQAASKTSTLRSGSYPQSLTKLQRAERAVAPLQARAEEVWQGCQHTTIPLSPSLRNAQEAKKFSSRLALHFLAQHQGKVAKRLVHLAARNLTWCLLPKVASTSWSRALQRVSGEDSDSSAPQIQLRIKHRPPSIQNLPSMVRNSESFLFVRHPFERLVTAYRSKLEDTAAHHDGDYFYELYGKKMVDKYRKPGVAESTRNLNTIQGRKIVDKLRKLDLGESKWNLKGQERRRNSLIEVDAGLRSVEEGENTGNLNLEETGRNLNRIDLPSAVDKEIFLGGNTIFKEQFVKDDGYGKIVNVDFGDLGQQPVTRDPTFEEFVDYLLDTDPYRYDEHWMPAALYCDVCTLKYNFVLKYEDFQVENEQFIRYLVAKGHLPTDFSLKWENQIGTDSTVTKSYMDLIPPNKRQGLIAMFEQDFSLFQYDPYLFE